MAGLSGLLQLLGATGGSFGGAMTGVGPEGPEIPIGGKKAGNFLSDPKNLAAMGFLGGGLSGMGGGGGISMWLSWAWREGTRS